MNRRAFLRTTALAGVVTQEGGVATGARPGGPLDANR